MVKITEAKKDPEEEKVTEFDVLQTMLGNEWIVNDVDDNGDVFVWRNMNYYIYEYPLFGGLTLKYPYDGSQPKTSVWIKPMALEIHVYEDDRYLMKVLVDWADFYGYKEIIKHY